MNWKYILITISSFLVRYEIKEIYIDEQNSTNGVGRTFYNNKHF